MIKEAILGTERFPNPTWDQIRALLHSLDGHHRTPLFIGDVDHLYYLDITGGHQGRYLVVVQNGDEGYYTLVKPIKGSRELGVTTGGMALYRPRAECQTLKTALTVAKTYFQTGKRDSRFTWRKSPTSL